jgi:hypothetical protein
MDNNQSSLLLYVTKKQTNITKHMAGKRLDNYLLFVIVSNQEKRNVIKHMIGKATQLFSCLFLCPTKKDKI